MKNLTAAVFVYVSTFEANLGKTTPTAYAERECAMDKLIAAAFEAVEESASGGCEAVEYDCVDATLGSGLELAEIITMGVQDGFVRRALPAGLGLHACTECLVVDILEEARDYLDDPKSAEDIDTDHDDNVEGL